MIVWLLRELTKKFQQLWIKVTDSDGEFLLIEASGTLPAWLEPEVAENRVWLNDGQLKIIKPANASRSVKRTEEKLTLEESHRILTSERQRVMHSESMEQEAFYRLRNYPRQIRENMHHALVNLPRKVAYLLLQKPAYVTPAIEAFYLRDPISLKPLREQGALTNLKFPPEDFVELSVKFPRVAYAQLKCQQLPALENWERKMAPLSKTEEHSKTETGMKLTVGFEILLSDSQYQDLPSVREQTLLLEDLESGDALLPTDYELNQLEKRSDDEKWLDIDFNDLQQELNRGKNSGVDPSAKGKKAEFGDKAAQENLQRIVKQFESFLNDDKMENELDFADGDDSDTDDLDDIDSDDLDEDKEASFGEDDFTRLMQEMMGMPPEVMKELQSGRIDALKNGAPQAPIVGDPALKALSVKGDHEPAAGGIDDEDKGLQDLTEQMGAELHALGALEIDPSKAGSSKRTTLTDEVHIAEDSTDEEVSIDGMSEQMAKDLLESFQAQGGASGPAGNLMVLMAKRYGWVSEEGIEDVVDKGKRQA